MSDERTGGTGSDEFSSIKIRVPITKLVAERCTHQACPGCGHEVEPIITKQEFINCRTVQHIIQASLPVIPKGGTVQTEFIPPLMALGENPMQTQVRDFMTKTDQVRGNHKVLGELGDPPMIRDSILREKLIREEANEAADAIDAGDLVEAVDGLCDLMYVTIGAFEAFGLDATKYFNIVHKYNMMKTGHRKDDKGKVLKPEGWVPPQEEIRQALLDDGWEGD